MIETASERQSGVREAVSDLDAEAAVLSACLLEPDVVDDVRPILVDSRAFYADANRRIWEAICAVADRGGQPDVLTVLSALREAGRDRQVGGAPYLGQLADATPAVAHVVDHARIVAQLWRQRRIVAACQGMVGEGYQRQADPNSWADQAAARIEDAAESGEASPGTMLRDGIRLAIQEAQAAESGDFPSVPGQLPDLNRRLSGGGYRRGKMHVIAGRPGMGKTAFALQEALAVAREGLATVFLTAEMDPTELSARALCMLAGVNGDDFSRGRLNADDWDAITNAETVLAKLPMLIERVTDLETARSRVRAGLRQLKRTHGAEPGIWALDYVQLLSGNGRNGRTEELTEVVRKLTTLAGDLDTPLLLLSQLNRDVEKRSPPRPQLSDLKETGALEENAYSALLLYREAYYKAKAGERPDACGDVAEIILAKNRGGSPGLVKAMFREEYTRFDAYAPEYEIGEDFTEFDGNHGEYAYD